ncbi:DUF551 domain-containing protein [Pseudochrobactrum lubricantis]|uniref:DUF551 domain-containing protein n=1 Tax=Pseudochrobactrum lubricantis TaxID=558172 RepID=UPI0035DAE1AB
MSATHTTAFIPDEAVQAFKQEFHENSPKRSYDENIKASLAAALPHLSAPCAVEVKKLDWSETSYGTPEVFTEVGVYRIEHAHDGGWSLRRNNKAIADDDGRRNFADQQKAKAAAQADFERRILSCVVTKPVDAPTKEERHANTARNLIINQTSTDLEQIIYGHDPEQSILDNDVWDRLDKMACEIEALTKPVDVAAVREECAEVVENAVLSYHVADCAGLADWKAFEKGQESGLKFGAAAIRALTHAEPAQGEQWRDIKSAPVSNGSQTFLTYITGHGSSVCYKTPSGHICSNSTGKIIHRATHWMPLPAAPTPEAGK